MRDLPALLVVGVVSLFWLLVRSGPLIERVELVGRHQGVAWFVSVAGRIVVCGGEARLFLAVQVLFGRGRRGGC